MLKRKIFVPSALEMSAFSAMIAPSPKPLPDAIMQTLYQLFSRIALACGVALGLGVLGAMAWASSEPNVETTAIVVDDAR